MIRHLLLILALPIFQASAVERWQVLPMTPAPIHSELSGHAEANGISIYYAEYGQGSPVILLHGGLANSDYWGNQVKALAPYHTVIVPGAGLLILPNASHFAFLQDPELFNYAVLHLLGDR
jgi:pimeloyl-ACP methyl ester carboxylesterase